MYHAEGARKPTTEIMMRMEWKQAVLFVVGIAALGSVASPAQTPAAGQTNTPPAPAPAKAPARAANGPEFSIGGSFYEALTASTTGNGTQQTTTNSPGGMVEMRLIAHPLLGIEFTYSYNPADQTLKPASNCAAFFSCATPPAALSVTASEVGVDYVASKKMGILRPFAVGGMGFFISSPGKSAYEVQTVVRPAFIFGGGVDIAVASHFGVRGQFRDNIYKAPNLSPFFQPTGKYTYSAEPMGGLYYSF
jgi:hypothetical protein